MDKYGFLKVAAVSPNVSIADCNHNAEQIVALTQTAVQRGVEIALFPELSVCGYTCGDLFLQSTLLDWVEEALYTILEQTRKLPITVIVGAPLLDCDRLYNCGVVITQGRILGAVPKRYIPSHEELSEGRWFTSGLEVESRNLMLCEQEVDFGSDLTFEVNGVEFGVELSEDLLVPTPPSTDMALGGAKVIFNLAAVADVIGKQDYIRTQIKAQSARTISAYVYANAGFGESTTDVVYGGGGVIAENGRVLCESDKFSLTPQLLVADIDIERLEMERRRSTTFRAATQQSETTVIEMEVPEGLRPSKLDREVNPTPFVPQQGQQREQTCRDIIKIQTLGLAQRLKKTNCKSAVIGISGGLDSTLALLITTYTFDLLGLDRKGIIGITMPGFGTSNRTYANANVLMSELGITQREISIKESCLQHFADIGVSEDDRSVVYENSQARERTQILMDISNMTNGMVVGTGDLSELALGWATYNGDHMSMYNVNCSVPKTLVQHLVKWIASNETNEKVSSTLLDIVDTPVSPELLPADKQGEIAQKTEDLVGPYELHDFFLYNFARAGFRPEKILYLAQQAFGKKYPRKTILKWMRIFFGRFFTQQFKRSAVPDGPKIGSLSLSPRGDWKMPSDASMRLWLGEVESL